MLVTAKRRRRRRMKVVSRKDEIMTGDEVER